MQRATGETSRNFTPTRILLQPQGPKFLVEILPSVGQVTTEILIETKVSPDERSGAALSSLVTPRRFSKKKGPPRLKRSPVASLYRSLVGRIVVSSTSLVLIAVAASGQDGVRCTAAREANFPSSATLAKSLSIVTNVLA